MIPAQPLLAHPLRAQQLIAHRGYRKHYPENSPLALRKAIEAGALWLELDVQLSRDDVPMLYHDEDLQRVSGRAWRVRDFTAAELQTFNAGEASRFGARFADVTIAPLHALVELLQAFPQVQALVELKEEAVRDAGAECCLTAIHAMLQPVLSRCVLISFDLAALAQARQYGFSRLGAVIRDWPARARIARELGAEMIICNVNRTGAHDALAMAEAAVALYEIDDPQQAAQLLARGATLIESFAIGEMLSCHTSAT